MQYDSLFSVSKAIAEKMGADSTKKYDSTYSVMLEILNRIGSTGGGDASKLESVDAFPTEGVKDGDVVYLKGNAEKADGFYVATLGGDGSATWTMVADDKIGVVATDVLPTAENAGDRLFLKTDNDGYNKIYGKYHTDRAVDKPMKYETNYYEATLNITDVDWEKITKGNLLKVDIIVPSISQNNQCIVEFDYKENLNLHISDKFTYIFYIATNSDREYYDIMYRSNNFVFCSMLINNDSHSIVIKSKTRDTNPFYVRTITIQGNTLDLSQSEGVKEYEGESVSQYMPYQDKDGNIIEGGKKLSEKYNPYHTTTARNNYSSSSVFYFPSWNSNGQITGGATTRAVIDKINNKGQRRYSLTQSTSYTIFAPETGGTSGQVLQSNGNAAPIWTDLIKIQKITQDAYNALETKDDNVLYVITD